MARHRKKRGSSGAGSGSRRGPNPYARADAHTKRAKAEGYVARSVFKLEEIDRRVRLLKQNQRVLDLGAAPGSWSAYAAQKVGPHGRVVSIDLKPLTQSLPPQAIVIEGDAYDEALLEGPLGQEAPYDVVLSDMAPNTTGDKATDQIRSFDVFMRALVLADKLLAEGGGFVGKLFMSGDLPKARAEMRRVFEKERIIKPEAVRSVSYEVFLVGTGRRVVP